MGFFSGSIYSECLGMNTHISIIVPEKSNDVTPIFEGNPRLLYLLHGLTGNADEWYRFSKIEYYAKKFNLFVIFPEVHRSFYLNQSIGINYFDYLTNELPEIIKTWFNVPTDREHTLIAGESMGGFGALKAALTYPQNYCGVASLSGVVNIRQFRSIISSGIFNDISLEEFDYIFATTTQEIDLLRLASKIEIERIPKSYICCGKQDFLLDSNIQFSKKLNELGYSHRFQMWNGEHEWPFWDVAIQRALKYLLMVPNNTPIF